MQVNVQSQDVDGNRQMARMLKRRKVGKQASEEMSFKSKSLTFRYINPETCTALSLLLLPILLPDAVLLLERPLHSVDLLGHQVVVFFLAFSAQKTLVFDLARVADEVLYGLEVDVIRVVGRTRSFDEFAYEVAA